MASRNSLRDAMHWHLTQGYFKTPEQIFYAFRREHLKDAAIVK